MGEPLRFEPFKAPQPSADPLADLENGTRVLLDPMAPRDPLADWGWKFPANDHFWDFMPGDYEGATCPINGDGTRIVLDRRISRIFSSVKVTP